MSKLKPLVFSVKDLAYIDEPCATKNFQNPHDHAVYKATEVDAHIDDLEESHKKEVEQLLMKIAELEKLVETANKLLKKTPILANIQNVEEKDIDPQYLELMRSTRIFSEIYAHGKLEEELGYDRLCVLHGCKTVIDAYENNKTIDVRVKNDDTEYKCKMFAWITTLGSTKRYVALVCLDSDTASCRDAAEKQKERRCIV